MIEEMERYARLLKKHDWFYEYSDDHRVWQNGREERTVLNSLREQFDPQATLWNTFAPHECKINVPTTEPVSSQPAIRNPKPPRL